MRFLAIFVPNCTIAESYSQSSGIRLKQPAVLTELRGREEAPGAPRQAEGGGGGVGEGGGAGEERVEGPSGVEPRGEEGAHGEGQGDGLLRDERARHRRLHGPGRRSHGRHLPQAGYLKVKWNIPLFPC
ncbi:hypothetical protein CDAR_245081 [Caerostris darwini]|uniref:Uncharacterized protein n=1 Tax=Caerostris darwini TaxID=1538125 RepID=A0AAV4P1C4_9ARAC|nr:hypothetical protein CDAR_245081 [Caerostris darwini]